MCRTLRSPASGKNHEEDVESECAGPKGQAYRRGFSAYKITIVVLTLSQAKDAQNDSNARELEVHHARFVRRRGGIEVDPALAPRQVDGAAGRSL